MTLHLAVNYGSRLELAQAARQCVLDGLTPDQIDEQALADALNSGLIAGAGVDVFGEEPPAADNPLLGAKNILVSPHSAAQTKEAVVNMALMCVEGCFAVLNGAKWPHVAERSVYDHPRWR